MSPRAEATHTTLAELLPLEDKTVSSFEMSSDMGEEGLLILEIFRPRPDMAELVIAGRTQRLLVEPHRITQLSGGTVLEEPLQKGHEFTGPFGRTTIVDDDVRVELPAGKFEHCLTTVEESQRPAKRAVSTYCRGVGLAHLVVETFGEDAVRLETRLTSHGPRFDVHDDASQAPDTPPADTASAPSE